MIDVFLFSWEKYFFLFLLQTQIDFMMKTINTKMIMHRKKKKWTEKLNEILIECNIDKNYSSLTMLRVYERFNGLSLNIDSVKTLWIVMNNIYTCIHINKQKLDSIYWKYIDSNTIDHKFTFLQVLTIKNLPFHLCF